MHVTTERFSVPASNQSFQNKDIEKSPCKTGSGKQVTVISNSGRLLNQSRLYGSCQQGISPFQKTVYIITGVGIFLSQAGYALSESLESSRNNASNNTWSEDSQSSESGNLTVTILLLSLIGVGTCFLGCIAGALGINRCSRLCRQNAGVVHEAFELREAIDGDQEDNQPDRLSIEDTEIDQVWIRRY